MLTLSRYRGCLLGLAAGDALGTTVEFMSPGLFPPMTDMVGGGVFRLKPGEWTDDTTMALCLAESLIEKGGFDPLHQLETYCRWWLDGHLSVKGRCFDIGSQTRGSLARFWEAKTYTPAPDGNASGIGQRQHHAAGPRTDAVRGRSH